MLVTLFISSLGFKSLGQITGMVQDSNGSAISYINVLLLKASDTTLVGGTITDDHGRFSMEVLETGSYRLQLSGLGYANHTSDAFQMIKGGVRDFGILKIMESTTNLDEVTVSTKRNFIQQTDVGRVINVQHSLMTQGSNALQVMERLPGVLLDRRNNTFNMNGQQGVSILFNGRRVPLSMAEVMALLESTLADTIDKIELITAPTAKYDADGGAGMINIVFKKGAYGAALWNVATGIGYGQGGKVNGSVQFGQGIGQIQLNTYYALSQSRGKNGFEGSGTSDMPILGGFNYTDFATYYDFKNFNQNMGLGLLSQINKKLEVGAELSYTYARNNSLAQINNTRFFQSGEVQESDIFTDGRTKMNNVNAAVFLVHDFENESRLAFDLSFLNYDNSSPAITTSTYFDRYGNALEPDNPIFNAGNRVQSFSKIQFTVAKADYAFKINEFVKAEIGVKGSLATNYNDSSIEVNNNGIWEIDPRSQSVISSDEKLWAAYTELEFQPNDKSSFKAGLRFENWERDFVNGSDSYHLKQLFPSLGYTYVFGPTDQIDFGYAKRISRPSYADLVTGLRYNDPTAIFTGNPLLTPSISNTLRIDYSTHGILLGMTLQKEMDPIFRNQFTTTPEGDILIVSPQNGDEQKSINLYTTVPWQWKPWAKLQINGTSSFRRYRISYTSEPIEKSYFFQSINGNQTFSFPHDLEMELSGWYNFSSFNGAHKTYGFGVLNFGLSKKLKKDWGTLQFTITDVFKSFKVRNHNGGAAPVVFDIDTRSVYRDESSFGRIFQISYSRSLGAKSTMAKTEHRQVEETERVN